MRLLLSGLARPRAPVLGNEFAGQVVAAGNGVASFRIGGRVFGYTEGPFGAHAEYLVIAEDGRIAIIPGTSWGLHSQSWAASPGWPSTGYEGVGHGIRVPVSKAAGNRT